MKATNKLLEVMKELHPAYVKSLESSSKREFTSYCQLMSLKPFLMCIYLLLDSGYDLKLSENKQEDSQEQS